MAVLGRTDDGPDGSTDEPFWMSELRESARGCGWMEG